MTVDPILYEHGDGGLHNATSSFASSTELGGALVILVYIVGALLAAQFVAPWLARSSLLGRVGSALLTSIAYALKGAATVAVLAVAALPAYLLVTVNASTRATGLTYVGYAIGAFLILVGVGQLADRAVSRFIQAHPEHDSWAELVGSDDLPDEDDLQEVADD